MSDETQLSESLVPQACTLPRVDQPARLQDIDDLFRSGVRKVDRVAPTLLRMELLPDEGIAARTVELALTESSCCSFFTFSLIVTGGKLALEVAVPPAHVDVLDALIGRAHIAVRS